MKFNKAATCVRIPIMFWRPGDPIGFYIPRKHGVPQRGDRVTLPITRGGQTVYEKYAIHQLNYSLVDGNWMIDEMIVKPWA